MNKDTMLNAKDAREKFLAALSPEDRLLHIGAGLISLHEQFAGFTASLDAMQTDGVDIPIDARVGVPVTVVVGVWEVMSEVIQLLEAHKLLNKSSIEAYMKMKCEEMDTADTVTAAEVDSKPDGWCPACDMVHDGSNLPLPIQNLARAIVSMINEGHTAPDETSISPTLH